MGLKHRWKVNKRERNKTLEQLSNTFQVHLAYKSYFFSQGREIILQNTGPREETATHLTHSAGGVRVDEPEDAGAWETRVLSNYGPANRQARWIAPLGKCLE